ncbi:hypothetical protein SPRG_01211 [Saprolegnia parasitica CBS 223.65]|uniref:Uncharacterized protein n=1 Tax=Saprolegnia parasitica (strain CBS 223.65) TaxID=695850 RepID=A0A067CWR4_SAPPC|nr:hypothetical protein SPRG_01211 [Saprolegnia parasitica CBS 223.65]KDO35144.1 hypothetical protein SPRG_01211 [Saprolegnia parasitica CBS 223.65]|eukprot:XP_012194792.1 hypothetical protein SPRG_01211 [Saprolegnia parasitica CBS 223.65]
MSDYKFRKSTHSFTKKVAILLYFLASEGGYRENACTTYYVRSKLIKQKSFAGGTHLFTNFLRYRAMLHEKTPEAEVKESMFKDGIGEEAANQFLESMRSNHERMAELERELEQLKRDNSIKRKQIQVAAPPT